MENTALGMGGGWTLQGPGVLSGSNGTAGIGERVEYRGEGKTMGKEDPEERGGGEDGGLQHFTLPSSSNIAGRWNWGQGLRQAVEEVCAVPAGHGLRHHTLYQAVPHMMGCTS